MRFVRNTTARLLNWTAKNKDVYIYALSLLFFYINSSYVSYPDEFSNILGGKLMLQGLVPFKDIFDHHMPFGWLLSAVILLFSFHSFILFRFWWAVLVFASFAALGIWIRRYYRQFYSVFLLFFVLYPLIGVYFWFHLLLADSLAALLVSLVFWIVMVQSLTDRVSKRALIISSVLTAAIIFSTLTYIYLAGVLYLWILFLWFFKDRSIKGIGTLIGSFLAPYIIFLVYLLITNSVQDFFTANISFNTDHYITTPNYVMGRFFNPIKFALTLIYNFYGNYLPLLSQIKNFDLYFPILTLAGLSTLTLTVLLTRRNIFLGILFFLLLSFSAPRSDITKISEHDYQVSVFIILGVMSSLFALFLMRKSPPKEQLLADLSRVVQLTILIFLSFTSLFVLHNTYSKYFQRYTQKMPSIIDYTFTSDFMNDIVHDEDYYWIGPFHPDDITFVRKGHLPGKYFYLMPQFSEDEFYQQDFLTQFVEHTPQFIIFPRGDSIFMTPVTQFGSFFFDWIETRYVQLADLPEVEVIKSPSSIDIKSDFYILKSQQEELLGRLRIAGYIK